MAYPAVTDLFPLFWDGRTEFVERYGYSTTVLTSRTGREQRRRRRIHPTGSFEYSFLGKPEHRAQLAQQLLVNVQGQERWVPWWPYSFRLEAELASGATEMPIPDDAIPMRTPTFLFHPIAFWRDEDTWEVAPVYSVGGGVCTLIDPTANTWPAGTRVVPLRRGWVTADPSLEWPTFDLSTGRLAWQLNDAKIQMGGWLEAVTVDTLDIRPSRNNPVRDVITRNISVNDPGLGERDAYVEDPAASRVRAYEFVFKSRAALVPMREFLDRRWGRAIPFWMPSWQRDFSIVGTYAADAGEFFFQGFGYAALYSQGETYKRVRFLSPDGLTAIDRTIVSVATDTPLELMEIDAALGVELTPDWKVMQLRYCRLEEDFTEIRWKTGQVSVVTLPVRMIPAPPPEIT